MPKKRECPICELSLQSGSCRHNDWDAEKFERLKARAAELEAQNRELQSDSLLRLSNKLRQKAEAEAAMLRGALEVAARDLLT